MVILIMLKCGRCSADYEPYPHSRMCRSCYNENMRVYMLARYYKRRSAAIEQLGGHCVDCDTMEDLEFDHHDSSMKAFAVGAAFSGWSEKRLQAELAKCVLRCGPCHLAKSLLMGDICTVPHGGGKSGKKHCYCDLCAPLKRAYARDRKRQIKDGTWVATWAKPKRTN